MEDKARDLTVNMTEQTITITRKDYFELTAKIGTLRKNLLTTVQMVRDNHNLLTKLGDSNEAFGAGEKYGAMRERAELCAYMEEAIASIEKELEKERAAGGACNSLKIIHFERFILVFEALFKVLMEHKFYPLNRKVINMPRWQQGQAFPEFPRLDKGGRKPNGVKAVVQTLDEIGETLPTANDISRSFFGDRHDKEEDDNG